MYIVFSLYIYTFNLDSQQALKHVFIFKGSTAIKWTNTEKLCRPYSHMYIFKLCLVSPGELSSLTLSVIYKWLFSLVQCSSVGCVSSPVSSFLICPKHIHDVTLCKDRTNCCLSLSLLKARCHFWIQLPTDTAETETILRLWKQMIWKWKSGKWAKGGRRGEEGKAFITHGSNAIRNGCIHLLAIVGCIQMCVCVYVGVMVRDNVAVRRDNVTSPAKPSTLWLQSKCGV